MLLKRFSSLLVSLVLVLTLFSGISTTKVFGTTDVESIKVEQSVDFEIVRDNYYLTPGVILKKNVIYKEYNEDGKYRYIDVESSHYYERCSYKDKSYDKVYENDADSIENAFYSDNDQILYNNYRWNYAASKNPKTVRTSHKWYTSKTAGKIVDSYNDLVDYSSKYSKVKKYKKDYKNYEKWNKKYKKNKEYIKRMKFDYDNGSYGESISTYGTWITIDDQDRFVYYKELINAEKKYKKQMKKYKTKHDKYKKSYDKVTEKVSYLNKNTGTKKFNSYTKKWK